MKKLLYAFAVLFLLTSCDEDNVRPKGSNPLFSDGKAIVVTPPATIVLKGTNLNAATEVVLNNQKLAILNKSENELEVQVPSGALSGTVEVKFDNSDVILQKFIKVIDSRLIGRDFEFNSRTKVDFLDATNAVKYDGNGIVYRSTDGGATWQKIYESVLISPSVPFKAYDANNIWVLLGGEKQLAVTQNGGDTWREITTLPSHIISDLFLLTPDKVVVTAVDLDAGKGSIYTTNNGGQTWTKTYESNSSVVNKLSLAYSNGNVMFLASPGGRFMLKSTDGGNTWSENGLLLNLNTAASGSAISFVNEQLGWAYNQPGISSAAPGIYKTTNGGTSWNLIKQPELEYDETISTIRFWNKDHGVAVTTKGGYMITDNGGESWRLYYAPGAAPQLVDLNQTRIYLYSDNKLLVADI